MRKVYGVIIVTICIPTLCFGMFRSLQQKTTNLARTYLQKFYTRPYTSPAEARIKNEIYTLKKQQGEFLYDREKITKKMFEQLSLWAKADLRLKQSKWYDTFLPRLKARRHQIARLEIKNTSEALSTLDKMLQQKEASLSILERTIQALQKRSPQK